MSSSFKRAICLYFLDDYEDDFLELVQFLPPTAKRKSTQDLIINREQEGTYSILVQKYLFSNDDKFYEFLRITPNVFDIILQYIQDDIYIAPSQRVPSPIDPSQKLCIALRYRYRY